MVNKLHLVSAIEKYNLNGLIESAVWNIKDKKLDIAFTNNSKDVLGFLSSEGLDIKNGTYAIYNGTSTFLKMVSILEQDILIETLEENKEPYKFVIGDTSVNMEFTLSNPMLISKPKPLSNFTFDAELSFDSEFIDKIKKSKKALSPELVYVEAGKSMYNDDVINFVVGKPGKLYNNIKFEMPCTKLTENEINIIPFKFDGFYEIMMANTDADSCLISINSQGLIKINFDYTEYKTKVEYYLIRQQNN